MKNLVKYYKLYYNENPVLFDDLVSLSKKLMSIESDFNRFERIIFGMWSFDYSSILRIPSNIKIGIYNLWFYFNVTWGHRFWDYSYLLSKIDKDLEYLEKFWGINTHYKGDNFTLGRIKILRKKLQKLLKEDEDGKIYKMNIEKFFKLYSKNILRLWD